MQVALFACVLSACPLPAHEFRPSDPTPVATRVRTAALFKNGWAFARREGELPLGATQLRVDELPAPAHGSFWITTAAGAPEVASAVARRTEVVERVPALDLEQLLRANVGRKLALFLGEKDTLVGTLVAMPRAPLEPIEDLPTNYGYRPQPAQASLLLLEVDRASTAIDLREVKRVVASDGALNREYERRRAGTSLTIGLRQAAGAELPFALLYLERGLTWVPSYSIELGDDGKALLTAKAEVIDEAEDLEGATLQFVTGFPNLQFAHVVDPLALRGGLDAFLNALGQQPGGRNSVVTQQALFNNAVDFESGGANFPVAPAPAPGEAVEDLFFYEQKGVTLARGERGLYPLFSVRVPCEHLYEWEIADTVDERPDYDRETRREPKQQEIWHSVRLSNDSSLPWTTAPAMTTKGGSLLGQDTLRYASVGGKTTVRITRALDVRGEQAEFEVARQRNAAEFYGSRHDKVTVHGELRVTNFKREPVRLEIQKRIQGEVTKNPAEAKVVALAEGLRRVNPNTRLTWSVELVPGKQLELVYEYTLYVRS